MEFSRSGCYVKPTGEVAMGGLERFLGGSLLGVLVKLIAVSVAVGAVLAWLNLTPWALIANLRRFAERVVAHGFAAIDDLLGYFLLGAMIVVPVWLVIRLVKSAPLRRR
jgi:hypothetical protein